MTVGAYQGPGYENRLSEWGKKQTFQIRIRWNYTAAFFCFPDPGSSLHSDEDVLII